MSPMGATLLAAEGTADFSQETWWLVLGKALAVFGFLVVTGRTGSVRVPALLTGGMLDGVVWLPTNSKDCSVRTDLGTDAGGRVAVTKGGAE